MNPQVAVIMGSDSDIPIMEPAADILDFYGVPYQFTIVSAHRTPKRLFEFALTAHKRGIKIILAGAGGSAHLPGMCASLSHLPVIGVPIKSKNLDGMDSLLSIIQMPVGVPVATVAINNAKNAGILAVQMLALSDEILANKLIECKKTLESEVIEKAKKIEEEFSQLY